MGRCHQFVLCHNCSENSHGAIDQGHSTGNYYNIGWDPQYYIIVLISPHTIMGSSQTVRISV